MDFNYQSVVKGPLFNTLQQMFEEPAPGSYQAYAKLTSIEEEDGVPSAEEMILQLLKGQETVARTARSVIGAADAANDEPTADLLTQRMQVHEKNAWMLRSMAA